MNIDLTAIMEGEGVTVGAALANVRMPGAQNIDEGLWADA
jgi:hypothetical protein